MAAPGPPTRQLHGYLSIEAFKAWQSFAQAQDTNVTALLEAIGRKLDTVEQAGRLPPFLREAVEEARRIAGQRSSRVARTPEAT